MIAIITRKTSVFINLCKEYFKITENKKYQMKFANGMYSFKVVDTSKNEVREYIQIECIEQAMCRRFDKAYVPSHPRDFFHEQIKIIQTLERRGTEIIYL